MCQLMGMNSNVPHDICFSFEGFHVRGGKTDEHRDGWGVAFFEGRGCRVFLDSRATIESPVADFVRNYPIHSTNVIAHIRKATRGRVALQNTHPFTRELWGRYWAFAHNGTLNGFEPALQGRFQPVGETDSELAFCYLLEWLSRRFPSAAPAPRELATALREASEMVTPFGDFNFLLSNGDSLFAFSWGKNLCYTQRRAPFGPVHLVDQDITVDFSPVTTANDKVAIIATAPLTDNESWTSVQKGELVLFLDGEPTVVD
jgi:predicted glutamine amidotransferase